MNRPGVALLVAILMSLLLSMVALGMVAMGTREASIAGAAVRRVQARASAESLARTLFHQWSTRAHADMAPGETRTLPAGDGATATLDRVDASLFLIRTEARVPTGADATATATARAGLLAGVFDPRQTALSFPAAATATSAATLLSGRIDGRDGCGSGRDAPGLVTPSSNAAPGAVVDGDPPIRLMAAPDPLLPDPFAAPIVNALATLRPRPMTLSPRPLTVAGACAADARNWGASAPDHPCHTLRPLVFADHDLTMAGGDAHAVVVVDGDLRLTGDAHLSGLLVVRGTLTIGAGASVRGAVRARRLVLDGGAIRADPCTVDAATSFPALDAAYRPARRWWVPVF